MFRWTIGELLNIFEEVRDLVYELDRNLLIPIGVDVSIPIPTINKIQS